MGSRQDKRIARIRKSPKNVRFEDLVLVLQDAGWVERPGRGSHCVYTHADHPHAELVVVKPHGGAKFCHPKAVANVLNTVEGQGGGDDDDGEGSS